MFHKILFRKVWGGAILLLPLLVFLLISTTAFGQDPDCEDASCSSLSVEIVRHGNVTPGCPTGAGGCNDGFSQIAYTVYLRRSINVGASDPLLPYNLEYDNLDVSVSLANPNNLNLFSHIDVDATRTCFENGVGAQWDYNTMDGNKVIFTPTDQNVTISFANLAPGSGDCGNTLNNTSNRITFTYTPPPGLVDVCGQAGPPIIRCAYAELFTVIVNAYPGEQNSLQFDTKRYLLDYGSSECTIQQVNTGPNNGLSSIQVLNPTHFAGTVNENILAQLLPPVLGGGPNEQIIPVQIRNTGGANITIDYLEFMVRGLTTNITEPFEYTLATPRTSVSGGGPNPVVHNLHYRIPDVNVTLAPNATHIVGNIIVKTPAQINLSWSFNFAFQDSGVNPSKSRIKTTNACTSLSAAVATSSGSKIGDAFCSDPSVHFKVEGEGANCTTTKAVKVGLLSTLPPASIRLRKVEFELEFSWMAGSGITITGVDFANWASINCATFGCYTNLGQKECWQVTPNSNGALFQYCYETNDANAPIFSLSPLANMKIMFNTPNGSVVENAVIRTLRISYVGSGGTPCIPVIDPIVGFPTAGSSPNQLTGTIETETNQGVEEVTVTLSEADSNGSAEGYDDCPSVSCSASCIETKLTNSGGIYLYCDGCPSCNFVKITPGKNDNPLNGVTTFDLVLISKHILGLEPLTSPYKMIAADANKSGSITTFDIVEFRKLILGIYQQLPANTSWRFVDKSFVFPNLNNPFEDPFPEAINCVSFPSSGHDFVGIKVGDLNNSVVPNNRPTVRPAVNLAWPELRAVSGQTITIPIFYAGTEPMEALQLGIRFDPSQLQLIGPSVGDIETYLPENFNLLKTSQGEIKTLWLPMNPEAGVIQPGSVLFNLTFKVLGNLPETGLPLWLDEQLLDCAAWKSDGTEYTLQQSPVLSKRDDASADVVPGLTAFIAPNPSSGSVTLTVQSLKAEKSRLALFDAFGQRLWMREIMLEEGQQTISMPEVAPLPSGVYVWKLYTPLQEVQGHLIKQ